jgi:hypothetical protein
MVSLLASSAVDRVFELRLVQIEDYKIGICCFSDRHAALRGKSKDWTSSSSQLKLTCSRDDIADNLLNWR